jgi:hypothetical protein
VALTPLELPGWLEFNERRSHVKAHQISSTDGGAEARAVVYLDRRGRIQQPPNNPYLPVVFSSARQRPSSRTAEWLRVAAPLAGEMKRRGVKNLVTLPPDVDDARPWQWAGCLVGVRYSYCLDFPFDAALTNSGTRRDIDKAARLGMIVERITDVEPVAVCLAETAARAGFVLGNGEPELRLLLGLLGPDSLRMYAAFDPAGSVASAAIVLHAPGERAIWWQAGTISARLGDGSGHLVWKFALDDLAAAGATGLDGCGANIRSVAEFKSRWGGRLVPTYTVRTFTARAGARFLADWLASTRGRE